MTPAEYEERRCELGGALLHFQQQLQQLIQQFDIDYHCTLHVGRILNPTQKPPFVSLYADREAAYYGDEE